MPAAPNPAAQLVKLGDTEPVGIKNDHERGVMHIHAHLNDGGGHQHIDLPGRKSRHGALLIR